LRLSVAVTTLIEEAEAGTANTVVKLPLPSQVTVAIETPPYLMRTEPFLLKPSPVTVAKEPRLEKAGLIVIMGITVYVVVEVGSGVVGVSVGVRVGRGVGVDVRSGINIVSTPPVSSNSRARRFNASSALSESPFNKASLISTIGPYISQ